MHKLKWTMIVNAGILLALSVVIWAAFKLSLPPPRRSLLAGGRPLAPMKHAFVLWQNKNQLLILQKSKDQTSSSMDGFMYDSKLESLDLRTGKKRRISDHLLMDNLEILPINHTASLSPDRTHIALVTGRITGNTEYTVRYFGLYVPAAYLTIINLITGRQRNVPLHVSLLSIIEPPTIWTTDGKKIVVTVRRILNMQKHSACNDLYIYDLDKNKIEIKRNLPTDFHFEGAIGPEKILFVKSDSEIPRLLLHPLDISQTSSNSSAMQAPMGEEDIYGLTPDGRNMLWQMPSKPPDGIIKYSDNMLRLTRRRSITILVTDLNGNAVGQTHSIFPSVNSLHSFGIEFPYNVQLSPDGRQVLYVLDGKFYVADVH